MSESAIDVANGPSLEQILWRSLDKRTEDPSLIDRAEFADRIASAFDGEVPAEAWVDRFFSGDPLDKMFGSMDMADAIVKATRDRLHVYEFDLRQLEYVIVEDKDQMVVVSDFGQFAFENNDQVSQAIESAIIPASVPGGIAPGSSNLGDREGKDARVYFVRATGEVVAVDVAKVAKVLDAIRVKQVSHAPVADPGDRMIPFAPLRRSRMSESREARALRQDARTRQLLPPAPALLARRGFEDASSSGRASIEGWTPPPSAATAIFVLMPDGSLARPSIGSATRWQDMVSDWSVRAQETSSFGGGSALPVSGGQRFTISSGQVMAVFTGSGETVSMPGSVGQRAEGRSQALAAVRADSAPIRILGDDELARAVAAGAMVVPGKSAATGASAGPAGAFWIQPEAAFAPTSGQRERLGSRGDGASTQGELVQGAAGQGAQPLQLGQITGDPWADWALTGGSDGSAGAILAARGQARQFLASVDRSVGTGDVVGVPSLIGKGPTLQASGAPIVAFRSPDGEVLVRTNAGPIRLASLDRVDVSSETSAEAQSQRSSGYLRSARIAQRTGAIPATALASLQLALERTARAGGYKLPYVGMASAHDALEVGAAAPLEAGDSRRSKVHVAGSTVFTPGAGGQVARMVLSMPFPNSGELHVGGDLSEALQSYLAMPVVPASSAGFSTAGMASAPEGYAGEAALVGAAGGAIPAAGSRGGAALATSRAGTLVLRVRGGSPAQFFGASGHGTTLGGADLPALHGLASQRGSDALVTLNLPAVRPLLSSGASLTGLPVLLQTALEQGGDWTPGPGSAMPSGIRRFAMQGPFDLPELVAGSPVSERTAPRELRALNPGEDEIVIPMPLWARMGRGALTSTNQLMASPLAPRGYAPPLGNYQLVAPRNGPIDATFGAPAGTPGVIEIAGPKGLQLGTGPARDLAAHSLGGRHLLGKVVVDDGQSVVGRRGRMRIGAPIDATLVAGRLAGAQAADTSVGPSDASANATSVRSSVATSPRATAEASRASAERMSAAGASPARLSDPSGSWIDGSFVSDSSVVTASGGTRPMASALQASLKLSDAVSSRMMPGRPGGSLSSFDASSSGSLASSDGGAAFAGRAASAARSQGGGLGFSSTAAGSPELVTGSSGSSLASSGGSFDSSGASGAGNFGSSSDFGRNSGAQAGEFAGSQGAGAGQRSSSGSTQSAVFQAGSASAAARRELATGPGASASRGSADAGLSPGSWSGGRLGDAGYQSWSYSSSRSAAPFASGGVNLGGLSRPDYPSLPTSLRFRYVGAPLWWSGSTGSIGGSSVGGALAESEEFETESASSTRALRSGVRAANSAAAIWRSIFVSGAASSHAMQSGSAGSPGASAETADATGGMDGDWEGHATRMGALGSRMDSLAGAAMVTGGAGAASGKGAETVYVAMNGAGGAGAVRGSEVQKARAQALQMNIVAAIPPAPPALESMGSGGGSEAPHARSKGHGHQSQDKEHGDAVSNSKIEGSVDAVAQRIYHRIRRRIQSDRERFGG
jgi:hypothetical protein